MKRSLFSLLILFSVILISSKLTGQTVIKATNGTHNYEVCDGIFTDSGDTTANYSNNEEATVTIYPMTGGAMVEVDFLSFATEQDYDVLYIYNGTSNSADLIKGYTGNYSPGKVIASNISGALTFVFTSDGDNVDAGWKAKISCVGAGLTCASIISPTDKAIGVSTSPVLSWENASGATSYDLTVATARGAIIVAKNITETSYNNLKLDAGTSYVWRVVPRNGADTASLCPIYSFTTLGCPTLSSPQNGATGVSINPFFYWTEVAGATSYDLIYSTAIEVIDTINTAYNGYEGIQLSPGTTYFWRVIPKNGTDTASSCGVSSFTTLTAPSCASSPSPANETTGVSTSTTLSWSSVATATSYSLYISTSLPLPVSPTTTVYTNSYTPGFSSNTMYYWKVVSNNGGGSATGCDTWAFTTASNLTLIYPNGGQKYKAGDTMQVTFMSAITGWVYFYLSNDSGITWPGVDYYIGYLNMGSSTGKFSTSVTIPASFTGSDKCMLKVYSYSQGYLDISDHVFTIKSLPPSYIITTPTTVTYWRPGEYQYIYWTTVNAEGTSKLYYSLNGETDWTYIGQKTSYNGTENYYYWYLPSVTGTYDNCKILITSSDSLITDESEAFTISDASQYVLINPTKEDTLQCNQYYTITFQNKGTSG